ncbi:MAG: DUF4981 domain-containing protein, partial [Cyclobacteriaceae bacterium]|nr:DUF4981 domain-containing protein [Cyclobacteriaceae bacterium]
MYQYIWFFEEDLSQGKVKIANLHDFLGLEDFNINWTISADGVVIVDGILPEFELKAHGSKIIDLDLPEIKKEPGVEYFLDFSVTLKKDHPFRKRGFEVAHEQFKLPWSLAKEIIPGEYADLEIKDDAELVITGENFSIKFDKSSGSISAYEVNGIELMQKGPQINFWRPPNDNDKGSNMIGRLGIWREVSNKAKLADLKSDKTEKDFVTITSRYNLEQVDGEQIVTYLIRGDGKIDIESSLKLQKGKLPDLPRFGMRWELPVNFDNLSYFGRGPHENYIDRKSGAFVGLYKSKVADQYFNYVRPQENGYKTDVRWFELRNENGIGIKVSRDKLLGFSTLHNPIEDFDQKTHSDYRHTNDIVKKGGVFITTDLKMMGV